ncbi:MAG: hypothetical protein ACTHJ5_00265 [Ilyomonas sp.]
MKRNIVKLAIIIVLISGFASSCMVARQQSNCPSHDPNYFRKVR